MVEEGRFRFFLGIKSSGLLESMGRGAEGFVLFYIGFTHGYSCLAPSGLFTFQIQFFN